VWAAPASAQWDGKVQHPQGCLSTANKPNQPTRGHKPRTQGAWCPSTRCSRGGERLHGAASRRCHPWLPCAAAIPRMQEVLKLHTCGQPTVCDTTPALAHTTPHTHTIDVQGIRRAVQCAAGYTRGLKQGPQGHDVEVTTVYNGGRAREVFLDVHCTQQVDQPPQGHTVYATSLLAPSEDTCPHQC
jgi:hypothetical protein